MGALEKDNRKSRNILIYPDLQIRFIFALVATSFVAPIILWAFLSWNFEKQINSAAQSPSPEAQAFYDFLVTFQYYFLMVFLLTLAITLVTSLIVGLAFSHKVAGPLVKLRNHMPSREPVQFREKDFFKDLAEAYNKSLK